MRFWPFFHNDEGPHSQQICPQKKSVKSITTIELPAPNKTGGMPLSEALNRRRSIRDFSFDRISDQQLSNLLWSACGVNGERIIDAKSNYLHTNPTACNHQEVMVYVFMYEGVYLYDSIKNCLLQIKKKDYRKKISKLQFIQKSAISLCLVSDISKMIRFDDSFRREIYSPMDVGYVSENIYLYCVANNLATCACGLINRDKIKKILGLNNARVMLVHPIGKDI